MEIAYSLNFKYPQSFSKFSSQKLIFTFKNLNNQSIKKPVMGEFWESSFIEKQQMWGFQPSNSAVLSMGFFVEKSVKIF